MHKNSCIFLVNLHFYYFKCSFLFKIILALKIFYSAMKKNEILSFAGKWMELENMILSKVSQAQKTKNHMFSLICGL
jgi:hypothetical protein